MAVGIFYPNALKTPDFDLTQLESDASPEINWEDTSLIAPGATFPGYTGLEKRDPMLDSSTTQIATVLNAMTDEGISIGWDAAVDMEYQQGKNLGGRELATDAKHTILRATKSIFFWKSIQAGETGFAKLDFTWKAILDALGNPPLVPSFNVPITVAPVVTELYRTGPVILTVAPLDGGPNETYEICNDGWTWDNNITVKEKKCSGQSAYSYVAVETATPKLTIPTDNINEVLPMIDGASIVSVDAYLRRAQQGGDNVDIAVPQHIKISSVVGTVYPNNVRSLMAMIHSFVFDTASVIPG